MEVLLGSLYGSTAVMALPWRCRGDPTADWLNPLWHCSGFEHVQSFRRATAKVCGLVAVPLRFMPYKHRSGTAPPVGRGY